MSTSTTTALAIGPREVIQGLAAFGVVVKDAADKEAALTALREARAQAADGTNPVAVVFITESLVSAMNPAEYQELLSNDLPVVLTIPDLASGPDAGLEKLASLTKRAVGVDIFSK